MGLYILDPDVPTLLLVVELLSCVLGLDTIYPTLMPLISIHSLPLYSFNLIIMSKLTYRSNCTISFFPDYCPLLDLLTKNIVVEDESLGVLELINELALPLSWFI